MDLRQTEGYGRYLQSSGWTIVKFQVSSIKYQVFIKKLPLLPWSIMKIQRWGGDLDMEKLAEIRKKYRVIYAVLEPGNTNLRINESTDYGYRRNNSPYLPTRTIVVDLTKSEGQLLRGMSKDTRQRIKSKIQILNFKSISNAEMPEFINQWKKQKKGYVASLESLQNLKKSFGEKCWVLEADLGERPLSGVVILLSDDTAFYYFAWTNELGREMGAQYHLVWEAMKMARAKGMKKFDLEGIFDPRWPLPRWKGFTAFKKKWGGVEVEFPGSWQKWF